MRAIGDYVSIRPERETPGSTVSLVCVMCSSTTGRASVPRIAGPHCCLRVAYRPPPPPPSPLRPLRYMAFAAQWHTTHAVTLRALRRRRPRITDTGRPLRLTRPSLTVRTTPACWRTSIHRPQVQMDCFLLADRSAMTVWVRTPRAAHLRKGRASRRLPPIRWHIVRQRDTGSTRASAFAVRVWRHHAGEPPPQSCWACANRSSANTATIEHVVLNAPKSFCRIKRSESARRPTGHAPGLDQRQAPPIIRRRAPGFLMVPALRGRG